MDTYQGTPAQFIDQAPRNITNALYEGATGYPKRDWQIANALMASQAMMPGVMTASKAVVPWRSKLQETIGAKMPNAMPSTALAQQVGGWQLPGEGPVTQEQLDWSGLPEWLAEKGGKVTKDEVQKYLKENDLQLEEVVKERNKQYSEQDFTVSHDPHWDTWQTVAPDGREYGVSYDTEVEAREAIREMVRIEEFNEAPDDTKFSQYQIPGGENYREMTINIPGPDMGYKVPSAHSYGDKADLNRLAHVRFNDRTGPNGEKVLFIEELQSDWHQEGRKKGYEDPKNTPEENKRKWDAIYARHAAGEIDFTERHRLIEAVPGVPDAPWKKTWPLKAFQRMVRYAAENGYDSISWTPGEVQADRYDLSKQVDEVVYTDTGRLIAYGDGGRALINEAVEEGKIEDYIGKGPAERLIKAKQTEKSGVRGRYISGEDLKVGDEGMKGFYDKILPAEVNKFFNKAKWGNAKVGTTEILTNPADGGGTPMRGAKYKEVWTLPITPEMKQKALGEGFWSSRLKTGLMGAYA